MFPHSVLTFGYGCRNWNRTRTDKNATMCHKHHPVETHGTNLLVNTSQSMLRSKHAKHAPDDCGGLIVQNVWNYKHAEWAPPRPFRCHPTFSNEILLGYCWAHGFFFCVFMTFRILMAISMREICIRIFLRSWLPFLRNMCNYFDISHAFIKLISFFKIFAPSSFLLISKWPRNAFLLHEFS